MSGLELTMEEDLVLVTGASGYIATHVIQQLQQAGYRVRGTVRSLKNEEKVKPLRNLCPGAKYPVELVEANLMEVDCWKGAVSGCNFVLHIASPFPAENPADENELIKPAVDGTLNVLKACQVAKTVRRVVLTSSSVAVSRGFDLGGDFTEENWTELTRNVAPYYKSKTLAEKAGWDFVNALPDDEKFELAVMNPCFVLGPILCGSFTTSMELPKRLLEKQIPMLARLNFAIVDVRDVAAAHIAGMTNPEAAGKRHLLVNGNMWIAEIAQCLVKEFKPQGYSIPTKVAPYAFMWIYALFDKSVKMLLPSIGKVTNLSNERMVSVLGIQPRPVENSIIDMCYSMIEAGMIKKTSKYKGPATE